MGPARAHRRHALRRPRRSGPLQLPHRSGLPGGAATGGARDGARYGRAHADPRGGLAERPRRARREHPRRGVRGGPAPERAGHRPRRRHRRAHRASAWSGIGHRGRGQPGGGRPHARALRRLRRRGLFRPAGAADVDRLASFASRHGFTLAYDPLHPSGPFSASIEEAPATDDRPFFFDTVPLTAVLAGRAELPYGYAILLSALVLALALGTGFAVLPLYAEARRAGGRVIPPGTVTSVAIGLGFIATELVLLQRLTLYLGQPSLALAVGIAALLGGAACGSALSARLGRGTRVPALLSATGLLLTLTLLPMATSATLAAPLPVRVAVALFAATLVGLPLGSVFPTVIREVGTLDAALVQWVWAVNGTASVVGAILAAALALAIGFTGLGAAAVACYGFAALITIGPSRFRLRRNALADIPAPTG